MIGCVSLESVLIVVAATVGVLLMFAIKNVGRRP